MPDYIDQMGRTISLDKIPKRIISLVPSQTELLADLGLEEEVIGITKFCIHPEKWFHSKTRIGGTKQFDFEKIKSMQPDLIIGNKEENDQEQVEELMKFYPVWMSDIKTLPDTCDMIRKVGMLTDKNEKAESIATEIEKQFFSFQKEVQSFTKKTVAYLIWKNPWMVAGKETFIDQMLVACGMVNVFSPTEGRYPEVTAEQLVTLAPELILLSSEPYPFGEKHLQEMKAICPNSRILLVDGEFFSWYGSRLLKSPAYFRLIMESL